MKVIKLSNGMDCFVDDEDYENLIKYNWHCRKPGKHTKNCYAFRSILDINKPKYKNNKHRRTMLQMHHFIVGKQQGKVVDHINGNTLDNRKENLRFVTQSENQYNRKLNKNNSSGHKGIHLIYNKYWRVQLQFEKKSIHIGCFKTKEEAIEAYKQAENKYFGEYARK